MLKAYHTSASTLNLIRAFTQGGFADLRLVHQWNKGFTENPAHARYESLARDIDRAIKFMASCGADFEALKRVEFYASHEALLLDYERAADPHRLAHRAARTTPRRTSCGSGSAPASSTTRTSTSSRASATRSA